jgi:NAD(P)-dependent dehydrogenase (short-subunit alcohol dehydrogenase family)
MGLLDGKVAIVTGAGRGLGREEAIALARHGATVIATARTTPRPPKS